MKASIQPYGNLLIHKFFPTKEEFEMYSKVERHLEISEFISGKLQKETLNKFFPVKKLQDKEQEEP